MRQVTSLHRTLVVLAVGLLALAAPLRRICGRPGPRAGSRCPRSMSHEGPRPAGLSSMLDTSRLEQIARLARPDDVTLALEELDCLDRSRAALH